MSFRFRNVVPNEVRDRIRSLAAGGQTTTVWQVTGAEVPIDDNGKTGETESWRTENFAIRYSGG